MDVVQRRQADRLAKIAFIVVWFTLTPTVAVVASAIVPVWLATVLGLAAGLLAAAVTYLVVLVWPAIRLVWHWAGEITALALLLAAYLGLTRLVAWWVALLTLAAAVGVLLVVPVIRDWLIRWSWCAISRHRLRTCFATFIRANRYGSLPWILLARPTRAGERIWVWLRPGLSLLDLQTEGGLDRLAVGCWAHQVKISRTRRRNSALIRVDITRRNPLAETVTSPLTDLIPETVAELLDPYPSDDIAPSVPVEPIDTAVLDLPGVPDAPTAELEPAATSRATTSSRAAGTKSPRGRGSATASVVFTR